MADWVAYLEASRSRAFRRLVFVSLLLHTAGLLAVFWSPTSRRAPALPGVVTVRFVSLPSAAPPAPVAPAPKVAPKPKPVVPKTVVLPSKPKPLEKPKPQPKKLVVKKPEPKPVPKRPEPEPQVDYEDFLAKLKAESGARPVAPAPPLAGQTQGPAGSQGLGVPISREESVWRSRAKSHARRNWVLAPGFRLQPLSTQVLVRLGPTGQVLDVRVAQGSGNPWYDDSVVRAVRKASPFPAPPDAGEYSFEFRPEDYL